MKAGGHTKELVVPEFEDWIASGKSLRNAASWSGEDEEKMRKYYGKVPVNMLAKHLNKTYDAVLSKAKRMGLCYTKESL